MAYGMRGWKNTFVICQSWRAAQVVGANARGRAGSQLSTKSFPSFKCSKKLRIEEIQTVYQCTHPFQGYERKPAYLSIKIPAYLSLTYVRRYILPPIADWPP